MINNICLIITVPHAISCNKIYLQDHPCDYYAEAMANIIKNEALKTKQFKEVWMIVTPKPRTHLLDMNRINSRSEQFRIDIYNKIKTSIKNGLNVWVLDSHSFPPDYYPYNNAKFTILDTRYGDPDNITIYVKKFIDFAKQHNISIQSIAGSDPWGQETNDIMDTSRELGAKSFLIETIESLSESDGFKFGQILIDFILHYQ